MIWMCYPNIVSSALGIMKGRNIAEKRTGWKL
jgi:hypothetical protein